MKLQIAAYIEISGMGMVAHPKSEQDITNILQLDKNAIFFVNEIDEENYLIKFIRKNKNTVMKRRF